MRLLGGVPLVEYTLLAARASRTLDRVVFSSDGSDMMGLADRLGVEVPFQRPAELATDTASSLSVVLHALDWLFEQDGYSPDAVVLLQPTTPFRDSDDIDRCVREFVSRDLACLISVSEVMQHPCEMVRVGADGLLDFAVPPPSGASRRQDFPQYFFVDGAVIISSVEFVRDTGRLFDQSADIVLLPPGHGIDIDDELDLALAEAVLRGLPSDGEEDGQ